MCTWLLGNCSYFKQVKSCSDKGKPRQVCSPCMLRSVQSPWPFTSYVRNGICWLQRCDAGGVPSEWIVGGASSSWMWVGYTLPHGRSRGRTVLGFLAAGAGVSGCDALAPSPFTSTDAELSILMSAAYWCAAVHGCRTYCGHVSRFSQWHLSGQARSLMICCTGNCSECSVVLLGFLHVETRFREKRWICTDVLPQYKAKTDTQSCQLGNTLASVV